ncbi:hypothetical protein KVT40_009038 [Elsinoe batatas]|uniref:Uncharacterized protein n=1 Tax=Elsinoe batatas TaxID=2601811 RepID=A0A8K0PCZ3_9PEZI|nr:hypothetical protein KVT40_009038 [Elsinoe batatas]
MVVVWVVGRFPEQKWLTKSILLTISPRLGAPVEATAVMEMPATWDEYSWEGRGFIVNATGEKLLSNAFWEEWAFTPDQDRYNFIMAFHESCLEISKRFMISHTSTLTTRISDTGQLWNALEPIVRDFSINKMPKLIEIPSQYYGLSEWQSGTWELFTDLDENDDEDDELLNEEYERYCSQFYYVESDPLNIPDMTQSVLQGLQPLPNQVPVLMSSVWQGYLTNRDHNHTSLLHRIIRLPWELRSAILFQHRPFDDMSREPNYLFPPVMWKEALLNGLLPWLWDLDHTIVESHPDSSDGREWNWEALARTLAQDDILLPGPGMPNCPRGLKNRRRIWQLVDDLRPDGKPAHRPYRLPARE